MIVVDTSGLMAILLGEREADRCADALEAADTILISSGTLVEASIVALRRGLGDGMNQLITGLGFEVVAVSAATARNAAAAYARRGKGVHPAGLNFGDCFAYALAKERGCPLLYVGDDFSRTDLERA